MQTIRRLAVHAAVLVLAATGHAATAAAAGDLRLIQAVKRGDVPAAQQLIRQKVDVNLRQPDGATALHWAADAEDAKMASLLLAAGAKADVANDYGVTPLLVAVAGRASDVVEVLLAAGAKVSVALPTGETALMTAARSGSLGAVKALLAKGADPNTREHVKGQNALMWAIVNPSVSYQGGSKKRRRARCSPAPRTVGQGQEFGCGPPAWNEGAPSPRLSSFAQDHGRSRQAWTPGATTTITNGPTARSVI